MTVYRSRKTNASANPFRQHCVNIGTPYNFVGLKSGGCGKIVYLKNLVCLVRNISETADYRLFLWFENEVSQWVSESVSESASQPVRQAVRQSASPASPQNLPLHRIVRYAFIYIPSRICCIMNQSCDWISLHLSLSCVSGTYINLKFHVHKSRF